MAKEPVVPCVVTGRKEGLLKVCSSGDKGSLSVLDEVEGRRILNDGSFSTSSAVDPSVFALIDCSPGGALAFSSSVCACAMAAGIY